MKLDGIEFHGFKSFADSADIRFHDGITAIVGPNGCGKSNVADGLRWVLGEQRPTAIRGSRMEEAIFQGTERRKPIHRAEVTLRLSNEDLVLPVPYSEVEISRTVHTGGEGEYRLNGSLCRLRDIQDLCRDTGLGTNAYAIIEGRMVDAILSDKAEERRAMFEEAAGIGRYKDRRRVAARRLDEADSDLARIDDLVSEVQTKVRSLARQRGRARRYLELRERKLALELALARAELERLERRRSEIAQELEALSEARVRDTARLRSSEAEHEALRARLADLERERSDAARRLMAVRDRVAERERERLVAEERARNASGRLDQLAAELRELDAHKTELRSEVDRLESLAEERKADLAERRIELSELEVELAEVGERRQAMQGAEAAVEGERQALQERRAQLQARGDAARAEAEALGQRLGRAAQRRASLASTMEEAQVSERRRRAEADAAQGNWRDALEDLEKARRWQLELQSEYEERRAQHAALQERLEALRARIDALAPMATGEDDLNPAVRAALERREALGIRDVLGRCIRAPEVFADGVEAYLGAFMEGLIVDDEAAVERIRQWFLHEYDGPGGLVLLPLDAPGSEASNPLPTELEVRGPGAPWVRRLLRDAHFGASGRDAAAFIGRHESRDPQGVFRLGRPYAGGGRLARRAELERLRQQATELEAGSERAAAALQESKRQMSDQAARVEEAETRRREAEELTGRLAARAETAAERLAGVQEELAAAVAAEDRLREERESATRRAEAEASALGQLQPLPTEAAPAPEELAAVQERWEDLRDRVTESKLSEARAAAAVDRVQRELRSQRSALSDSESRWDRLTRESTELRERLELARSESENAARILEELFEEREQSEEDSREMEARAEEVRRKVSELEATVRRAQQEERGHSERLHELELERTQIEADRRRTRERLEDEWGRPFDELAQEVEPAEGDPAVLREELTQAAEKLGRIGLVNMLAEQEYQEEQERLEFLESQRSDLVEARDDLRATIRRINETASKAFLETLEQIRENFERTFATLFQGGECNVWLEDPDEPLDSPVEISASPGGKRTQRIHLLSGGERALTALSLLFAIYLVKPSPFCVLDEVDAPLDETNIRRFVAMLEEFKSDVQFIVITHNPVTIEAADWIYGVTMEEPGVSKVVGVEFSEYARGAVA